MYFGVLYLPPGEPDVPDAGLAVVCVYEPHRVWTLAGPPPMAPFLIRSLRDVALETGGVQAPRCETCGEPLDVPPLDDLDTACASA